MTKRMLFVLLGIFMLLMVSSAVAQVTWTSGDVYVRSSEINGDDWLFLPSGAKTDAR